MSNAIFAPNHQNLKDDLYVYGFWDYVPANGDTVGGEGIFVPSGMTFLQDPRVNNEWVGTPNPVILRWTKQQYTNYITKVIYKDFVSILWNNAKKSEEPIQTFEGKNIYEYTFNSIPLPSILTEDYDLTDNKVEAKNILIKDLADMISKNNFSAELFVDMISVIMPAAVPAEDVAFNPDHLLLTMCRYLPEDYNILFDCRSALDFEVRYLFYSLSPQPGAVGNSFAIKNHTDKLRISSQQSYRLPDQKRIPKPNCALCSTYVVGCDYYANLYIEGWMMAAFKFIYADKGLYLAKAIDLEPPIPADAKLFKNLEDAKKYYFETLENTPKKWICISGMVMGDPAAASSRCVEILESCAFVYEDDENVIIYDTQQECEENCNKKWYCLEYQCTKVDKDSQLVEGLEGYDTQQECEENCEIPTLQPEE